MIQIKNAAENNLKHVDVSIPKNKLVVFAGVSGSGKSSLVFDTLAVESMRQLGEILPPYVRNRMTHYEMPKVQAIHDLTPAVVIQQRQFEGDIRSTVGTMTNIAPMLRLLFSRCAQPKLASSAAFSFNAVEGMCKNCSGLGSTVQFDLHKLLDDEKTLNEGAISFPGHQVGTYQWQLYANSGLLDPDKRLKEYTKQEWHDFLHGEGIVVNIHNTTGKVWNDYQLTYEGFLDRITRLYLKRDAKSKNHQKIIREFTTECRCPNCGGARLNPEALNSRLNGMNIAQVGDLEIRDLLEWLSQISDPVGTSIARKIIHILEGIQDIGLPYLCLNRSSKSLSGGERQRLRIVRHLGSSLNGLTYILDEPSVGLHPQDVEGLIALLQKLRDKGNSVIVVEHNKQIIRCADYIFEMGPEAGEKGGRIIFEGTPAQLMKADTPTSRSLRKHILSARTAAPRKARAFIELIQAHANNLKNISVHIPKEALTVVSGPAGSGKSSLICIELMKKYPQAVYIDQKAIGITSRSNPATYVGIMNQIRKLFAEENHVDDAMFSYNSDGACPMCQGRGIIKTEMAFMDPVTVTCEMCGGTRYCQESLHYDYHGKNILDVMNMTVNEALQFFDTPKIGKKLQILQDVGLGYLTLGHPISELSGGECQRIKLAGHLKDKNGLFVFDEPTMGLHGNDVGRLVQLFQKLVRHGNTVVVVEHNTEMIAQADWNIDLGTGGGKNGGKLIFEGYFEDFLRCNESPTVQFLRQENKQNAAETLVS